MSGSEFQTQPHSFWRRSIWIPLRRCGGWLGPSQIDWPDYFFLSICVVAQAVTIAMTWSAWQVRPLGDSVSESVSQVATPNLPWIEGTPQFSMAVLLIASLLFSLLSPWKLGTLIHLLLLGIAIAMDQLRFQPQVFSIAFLMAACVWPQVRRLCVWYLIAMWTWAGIHKFLSPDLFGHVSYRLLELAEKGLADEGTELIFNLRQHYWLFAAFVAASEIATGVLAWWRPRLGGIACALLHLGIACFLVLLGWNYSVLPWNLSTAIVGAWLIWKVAGRRIEAKAEISDQVGPCQASTQASFGFPRSVIGNTIVACMFLVPIGFYFGLVRHSLAHALYSDNLPICVINRSDRVEFIDSWEELGVPFPNALKPYRDYFKITGRPGDTMHIKNQMSWLKLDQFFRHHGEQDVGEISKRELLSEQGGRLHVCEVEDPRKMFELLRAGAKLHRNEFGVVFAIQFYWDQFQSKQLELLSGAPNVQQLQFEGCPVSDEDLKRIPFLGKLYGVGLGETQVTDEGLKNLAKHPMLFIVEYEGSRITDSGHHEFIESQTGREIPD